MKCCHSLIGSFVLLLLCNHNANTHVVQKLGDMEMSLCKANNS